VSGPKVDQVELERHRKAELERLRQERLKKIRAATEKLNAEISAARTQIGHIDKHLLPSIRNMENAEEMALTIKKVEDLKSAYKGKLIKALEMGNVPTEPDAISARGRELASVTKSVMTGYFNEVKPFEDRIQNYIKQLEIQNTIAAFSKNISTEIEKMDNIEDFDFTINVDNVKHSAKELNVQKTAAKILSEIEGLVNNEAIQESDMKDLLAIAGNIYKTAFETKNSFEAAVIEYNTVKPGVLRNITVFDDLYQDYFSECVVYLELINKNRKKPVKIAPQKKYLFSTIEELNEETTKIARDFKTLSENNYIREQINEVMQSVGYNLLDEIVFGKDQLGNHYLCESKSGKSAIHMHISDGKRVMMEIVNTERDVLLNEQGRFCDLHPKIIEELKKRGVIFNKIARNEPDLKYYKKINSMATGDETSNAAYKPFNERATERGKRAGIKAKRLAIKN